MKILTANFKLMSLIKKMMKMGSLANCKASGRNSKHSKFLSKIKRLNNIKTKL